MELTNINTEVIQVFNSLSEAAKYIRNLNPDFKASPVTISDTAKSGRVYKGGLFKVKFIN